MKIITMQRKELDGKRVYTDPDDPYEHRDWWGVIETEAEKLVYEQAWKENNYAEHVHKLIKILWSEMVNTGGVNWGDDDVYGYIMPDETMPKIGDEYKDADGDVWVRVE